jgi:hypothetical protein
MEAYRCKACGGLLEVQYVCKVLGKSFVNGDTGISALPVSINFNAEVKAIIAESCEPAYLYCAMCGAEDEETGWEMRVLGGDLVKVVEVTECSDIR